MNGLVSQLSLLAALLLFPAASSAHVGVTAPHPGEVLFLGTPITVEWEVVIPHMTDDWDVYFSTVSDTGPWTPIALDIPAGVTGGGDVESLSWLPLATAGQVWIRVVQDNQGTDYEDVTDGPFSILSVAAPQFLRGDTNDDGNISLTDMIGTLLYLFSGGAAPACLDAADVDGDGQLGILDPVLLGQYLFAGGAPPVAPHPACAPGTVLLGCSATSCP